MKKETVAVIALVALICIGQSLTYYDEVEQAQVNCKCATYQQDNKGACDE